MKLDDDQRDERVKEFEVEEVGIESDKGRRIVADENELEVEIVVEEKLEKELEGAKEEVKDLKQMLRHLDKEEEKKKERELTDAENGNQAEKENKIEQKKEIEKVKETEEQKEIETEKKIEHQKEFDKEMEIEREKEIEKEKEIEREKEIETEKEIEREKEIVTEKEIEEQKEKIAESEVSEAHMSNNDDDDLAELPNEKERLEIGDSKDQVVGPVRGDELVPEDAEMMQQMMGDQIANDVKEDNGDFKVIDEQQFLDGPEPDSTGVESGNVSTSLDKKERDEGQDFLYDNDVSGEGKDESEDSADGDDNYFVEATPEIASHDGTGGQAFVEIEPDKEEEQAVQGPML